MSPNSIQHNSPCERSPDRLGNHVIQGLWDDGDFVRPTFFHSAATCLHEPEARRTASRRTSRGSGGPTNGTWSAAVKSWAALCSLDCFLWFSLFEHEKLNACQTNRPAHKREEETAREAER